LKVVYKITVDGGLIRERVMDPSIRILRNWELEGRIEIFETDRSKDNAATSAWAGEKKPTPQQPPKFRKAKAKTPGSLSFAGVASILFPHRDPNRLTMTEINSVTHLIRHHICQHFIFVTINNRDFIDDGKREQLKAAFNIVVLRPEEAVQAIERVADWKDTDENKPAASRS
jgi:hypothetical protein